MNTGRVDDKLRPIFKSNTGKLYVRSNDGRRKLPPAQGRRTDVVTIRPGKHVPQPSRESRARLRELPASVWWHIARKVPSKNLARAAGGSRNFAAAARAVIGDRREVTRGVSGTVDKAAASLAGKLKRMVARSYGTPENVTDTTKVMGLWYKIVVRHTAAADPMAAMLALPVVYMWVGTARDSQAWLMQVPLTPQIPEVLGQTPVIDVPVVLPAPRFQVTKHRPHQAARQNQQTQRGPSALPVHKEIIRRAARAFAFRLRDLRNTEVMRHLTSPIVQMLLAHGP